MNPPSVTRHARTLLLVLLALLVACGGSEADQESATTVAVAEATNTPEPAPTDPPEPTLTPTPQPTATPDIAANFVDFESAEGGYQLRYPDGWFTEDFFGLAVFASNEALLDSPDPGEEGGIAVILTGDETEFDASNPADILTMSATEFELGEDSEFLEGPSATLINGQQAATAVIRATSEEAGIPLIAYVVSVVSDGRTAVLYGATPEESRDEFLPLFEAMGNSIVLIQPAIAAGAGESEGFVFYGDSISAAVAADQDSRWSFLGVEGDAIDIIIDPADELDAIIDILDSGGISILGGPIDDSFGTEEILELALPTSDEFVIVVTGFAGSAGSYELRLREASSISVGENAIEFGEFIQGSIVDGGTATWNFFGNAGDFIDITAEPLDEEFDLTLELLDSSGRSVLEDGPVDASFDTEFVRLAELADDDVYTVVVAGFEGSTGAFELLVDRSNNGGQPGSIVYIFDTLEEDDAEGHSFPFTAGAGEVVTIQVRPIFGLDVYIEVRDDDTDEALEQFTTDITTGFEELVFMAPADGDYYFQVLIDEESEELSGDYDANVLASADALVELAVDDHVVGRFDEDGFVEYWLGGDEGDTVTLSATSNEEVDLVLEVLDQDDNVLASVDDAFFGERETLSYTFTGADLVIVRISDFFEETGTFEMDVE